MTGFTDYGATKVLGHVTGKLAYTSPSVYIGLFTAAGPTTDSGTFTEVTGGTYARVNIPQASWNSATAGAPLPSTITNSATITFNAATANWGNILAWGLFDASSAGNMIFWDYMGNFNWLPFTATLASPSVFYSTGHGYTNGDTVIVTAEYGGTLPTGGTFSGNLTVAGVSGDNFNVGVNASAAGDGMIRKVSIQTINTGVTASFAASTLTLSLA